MRSGVAPDHQDTKNVINQFTSIAKDPRVGYYGNVRVGAGGVVSLDELRSLYNAVVLSYGCENDRLLNLPGKDLHGILSARDFVWWYNSHPASAALSVDLLSVRSVVICGLGNVALDCARVLLQSPERIAKTDAAAHAVDELRRSAVTDVHVVGRRGPAQAAFTPKELRELLEMDGLRVRIYPKGCLPNLSPECEAEIKASRIKRRVVEVLQKASARSDPINPRYVGLPVMFKCIAKAWLFDPQTVLCCSGRTLHIHFLRSPLEVIGNSESVSAIRLGHTELQMSDSGDRRAISTGQFEDIPAQLVLESIGYRANAIEGAPFDPVRGVIPNDLGQVISGPDRVPIPGLFVSGWLKRGPTGIIGTNLIDAEQTVDTMVRSHAAQNFPPRADTTCSGCNGLAELLERRGYLSNVISFEDWEAIDAEEIRRGQLVGKPREKFTAVGDMIKVAQAQRR